MIRYFFVAVMAIKIEQKAQWGFLKNIINIDSFFAAPRRGKGGGEQTELQLESDNGGDAPSSAPVAKKVNRTELAKNRMKKMI